MNPLLNIRRKTPTRPEVNVCRQLPSSCLVLGVAEGMAEFGGQVLAKFEDGLFHGMVGACAIGLELRPLLQ